jgi:hypothetical protein
MTNQESAKVLVEQLSEYRYAVGESNAGLYCALDCAIRYMRQFSWRDRRSDPPLENGKYLVFYKFNGSLGATYLGVDVAWYEDGIWTSSKPQAGAEKDIVTYRIDVWMPLPEPGVEW